MKKIKFEIEINNKKYLMQYRYQNCSFPLFAFEIFSFKLFGVYWNPISLKVCGSLYPKQCLGWTLEQFRKHATNIIYEHLNVDSDTNKSIKNFSSIKETE